ncbi:MAG: Spy/CpxP family protein refolding chaperone [Alphaproteobacteria bacterium]|nr:Spy/CpxP family protein refolding chaperone [Alphaproteobacteria bacterium]
MKGRTIAIVGAFAGFATIVMMAGTLASAHNDWREDKLARFCGPERGVWITRAMDKAREEIKPTEAQLPAWNSLNEAVQAGDRQVAERCEEIKAAGRPTSPPERLARAEVMMATGLSVIETVRPAFEDFYAVLSDDQKAAADELTHHRRHSRRFYDD